MSSEIQSILNAFEQIQHQGKSAFLATVVGTQGSTYRRSGARLLIAEDGQTVGLVSGGCLERDLFEHTQQRMPDCQAKIVTYDRTATGDTLWGFGLGCTGTVQVLVERLHPPHDPLTFIAQCWRDRSPGVLVSVIQAEDPATGLGACLALTSRSIRVLGKTESELIEATISDAQAVLKDRQSALKQYKLATQQVNVLLEFIQPPIPLMIFGAGQDAVPIAEFAKVLGWHVTVVDCRANPLSCDRFTTSDRVILARRERLDCLAIEPETVAAIATHNYYDDLEALKVLLPASIRYIGLLGSKQRTERLLHQLQQETTYTDVQLAKLHAPVGLDIGAETPEEIALSIITEIKAFMSGRFGGSLRTRNKPIHMEDTITNNVIAHEK